MEPYIKTSFLVGHTYVTKWEGCLVCRTVNYFYRSPTNLYLHIYLPSCGFQMGCTLMSSSETRHECWIINKLCQESHACVCCFILFDSENYLENEVYTALRNMGGFLFIYVFLFCNKQLLQALI